MLMSIMSDSGEQVDVDCDPGEVNFDNPEQVDEMVNAIRQAVALLIAMT